MRFEATRSRVDQAARVDAANSRFRELVESARLDYRRGNKDDALNSLREAIELDLVADKSDATGLLRDIDIADANAELQRLLSLAKQDMTDKRFEHAVDLLKRALAIENARDTDEAIELLRNAEREVADTRMLELVTSAKEAIAVGQLDGAKGILHRAAAIEKASDKEEAVKLLHEVEFVTSSEKVRECLSRMTDEEFKEFRVSGTVPLRFKLSNDVLSGRFREALLVKKQEEIFGRLRWEAYWRDCGKDAQRTNQARTEEVFRQQWKGEVVRWSGVVTSVRKRTSGDGFIINVKMNPSDSLVSKRTSGDGLTIKLEIKLSDSLVPDLGVMASGSFKEIVLGLNEGQTITFVGKISVQGGTFTNHILDLIRIE